MTLFDTILLVGAKFGLVLLALMILVRWMLTPYLWWKYDRPIQLLNKELVDFKKKEIEDARGRGIVQSVLDARFASKEKQIAEQVKTLETKRRHFLDRANLFLTVSSLGK